MPTHRIYYTDAERLSFDAQVTAVEGDCRRVYLDRTAFYPTSGGQPHDLGTLAGRPVIDVIDEGDRIAHVLAEPLPVAPGSAVDGHIDAPRRRDFMQQHTGQHLLSAIFADVLGAETVSVHFGVESSTLELDVGSVAPASLRDVEARANAIVAEARPVTVSFEDAASAAGLRKAPARGGEIRVVTIDGIDRSACGGTHVATTARIGTVVLRETERIRQRVRVEFACGDRALARAREDFETLAAIAQQLSASARDVPALVAAQQDRLRLVEGERRQLAEELAGYRARQLHASAEPDGAGRRLVVERLAGGTADVLRDTAKAMAALPGAVYVGTLAEPPLVAFAAAEDTGVEAGRALQTVLKEVGGRGGGSARVAQGSVPDVAALEEVIAELARRVGDAAGRTQ